MEINNCKFRLRCEMGACGKRAEYTVQPARVGIRSSIHICGDCLAEIVSEGKKQIKARSAKAAAAGAAKETAADETAEK